MAVYRYGKKTSDINVQSDFSVKDLDNDAYIKNRPDSTLSISLDGVEQEKQYNPNTGDEIINIDLTDVLESQDNKLEERIESLQVPSIGGEDSYISQISETDGKISATAIKTLSNIVNDSKVAVNSIAVSSAISTAVKTVQDALAGKSDKSHTHDDRYYTETEINTKLSSDVTSNNLINALSTGDSVPIDGDYFISQYAGGSTQPDTNTSKNNFYRRPISTLWSYIKSKIEATRLSHSKGITISNTTDVTLSSFGSEGLSIGTSAGTNIGIDNNEIQARNNGAAAPLYINGNGGAVYFGAGDKYYISSDGSSYNGTAAKSTADGSGNNIVNTYATKTAINKKTNYDNITMVDLGFTVNSYVSVRNFWAKLYEKYGSNGVVQFGWANAAQAYIGTTSTYLLLNGGTLIYTSSNTPSTWSNFSAIFYQGGSGDNVYYIRASISADATVGKESWSITSLSKSGHNHDSVYAAKSHTHDDRYYTESEINAKLSSKSDTGHSHSIYVAKNTRTSMASGSGIDFNTNKALLRIPVYSSSETTPTENGAIFIQNV